MYFRADETDKAYKEAISIAYKRKDTNSVSLLKEGYSSRKNCYIEVLNMDAVRLNLHKETDKENPLMQELEDAIESSSDLISSALSVMITANKHNIK